MLEKSPFFAVLALLLKTCIRLGGYFSNRCARFSLSRNWIFKNRASFPPSRNIVIACSTNSDWSLYGGLVTMSKGVLSISKKSHTPPNPLSIRSKDSTSYPHSAMARDMCPPHKQVQGLCQRMFRHRIADIPRLDESRNSRLLLDRCVRSYRTRLSSRSLVINRFFTGKEEVDSRSTFFPTIVVKPFCWNDRFSYFVYEAFVII